MSHGNNGILKQAGETPYGYIDANGSSQNRFAGHLSKSADTVMKNIMSTDDSFTNSNIVLYFVIAVISVFFIFSYGSRIGKATEVLANLKWGEVLKNTSTGQDIINSDGVDVKNPNYSWFKGTLFGSNGQQMMAVLNVLLFMLGGSKPIINILKHYVPSISKHVFISTIISVAPVIIQLLHTLISMIAVARNVEYVSYYIIGYGVIAALLSCICLSCIWLNWYQNRKRGIKTSMFEVIFTTIFNVLFIVYGCTTIYSYVSTPTDVVDYMKAVMTVTVTRGMSGLGVNEISKLNDVA